MTNRSIQKWPSSCHRMTLATKSACIQIWCRISSEIMVAICRDFLPHSQFVSFFRRQTLTSQRFTIGRSQREKSWKNHQRIWRKGSTDYQRMYIMPIGISLRIRYSIADNADFSFLVLFTKKLFHGRFYQDWEVEAVVGKTKQTWP